MRELREVAESVVLPAVRAVFSSGEVTSLDLRVVDGSVLLTLTVRGETFHDDVAQRDVAGMSDADWSERLRSNLVDFAAESRFGWGENRDEP